MRQFFSLVGALLILLFFHETVFSGAKNGLLLWYQILVPTLLPFILITNALSETHSEQHFINRFHTHKPAIIYTTITILLGALCGYPIGAKLLNDYVKNHNLSATCANQLLSISSQASPMFLVGYVYYQGINNAFPIWYFLFSIYFPVVLLIFRKRKSIIISNQTQTNKYPQTSLTDTFMHSVEIIVQIGLYVLIFSILLSLFQHLLTGNMLTLLSPLELTNGIQILIHSSLNSKLRIALICGLSSFGGICSSFQVFGVINSFGVNKKRYYIDKCILSLSTFFLVILYFSISL